MKVANPRWLGVFAAGLLFAAYNGNWLLSRKSNGASTFLLAGVWIEIALGVAVAWWAYRRLKAAASTAATT